MNPRPSLSAIFGVRDERPPLESFFGAWEADPASPTRERRQKPGGGFEYRAVPRETAKPEDPRLVAKRALLAEVQAGGDIVREPQQPGRIYGAPNFDDVKAFGANVASGMKQGAAFVAAVPGMVSELPEAIASLATDPNQARAAAAMAQARRGEPVQLPPTLGRRDPAGVVPELPFVESGRELVRGTLESVEEERERLEDEAAAQAERGMPPALAALSFAVPQTIGNVLDPSLLYGAAQGRLAGSAARRGLSEAAEAAAPLTDDAVREIGLGLRAHSDDAAELARVGLATADDAERIFAAREALPGRAPARNDRYVIPLAEQFDTGSPGFSVEHVPVDSYGWYAEPGSTAAGGAKRAVYRDSSGKPLAGAVIVSEDDGLTWKTEYLGTEPAGSLIDARASMAIKDFLATHKAFGEADGVSARAEFLRAKLLSGGGRSLPLEVPPLHDAAPLADDLGPAPAAVLPDGPIAPQRAAERIVPESQPAQALYRNPPSPEVGNLQSLPADPLPTIPMSTKAVENVSGMQSELRNLVNRHRDVIEKARGPVKSVSRWADHEALANDLGMTADDFLRLPSTRTLSDDEFALGRSYMGGMKQELTVLSGRITRGEIPAPEVEAARTRLAELQVDTVRMMATLQGQGSSTAGRLLRAGQVEALASTPREKLQLALLKNYGTKNAEEAARVEARAVARLRRTAAHETRKLKRTATAEELATEFATLAREFNRVSGSARPRAFAPDMVELVGRMAQNRVKAGVVAVEQIADEIYQVARQHIEGLALTDVKAAIVEHALVKPPKRAPAEARLAAAEGAATRRVATLEARLATGPQLPPQRAAAVSGKLSALRQQAADLRSQILKDPREGLVTRYRELLDDQTVQMIAAMPADPESPALLNFLRQMEKPTFRDYRMTYFINSILSGSKTMQKNGIGNTVRLVEMTAMRPAGAVVEQFVLAPLQGRVPERLVRETLPAAVGVFRGVPEGLRRFVFVMREGYDPQRLVAELTGEGVERWGASHLPVSPFLLSENRAVRGVGAALTYPSRILEATDALAKVMAQTSEQYAWATRKAIQEGADDVPGRVADLLLEQPDEMIEAGRAWAKRATYQDPMSWVGRPFAAIRKGVPGADKLAADLRGKGGVGNRVLAGAVQAPQTVMEHMLPFIHISDRVAAALTDYIPGAKPFKLAHQLAEQSPEAADLIARQVVGGAFGFYAMSLAADGRLVGAAPRDPKLRDDFYAEGKQPYSVLAFGKWIPFRDLFGPLAGPFVAAALYHDHLQVGEDPTPALVGMSLGTARFMLDASYMQSLQDVLAGIEENRSGDVGRKITSAGARVAGGYVPFSGMTRSIATANDLGEDGNPRVVSKEGFVDELKAGIPGLRQQLPSRADTLGNELTTKTGPAGAFIPGMPTENLVADPQLSEEVGRLRHTVEKRRSEVNKIRTQIKEARKAKDPARLAELKASMPPASAAAGLQAALERARGLEARVRKDRADKSLSPEVRRARELRAEARMKAFLERALQRLESEN